MTNMYVFTSVSSVSGSEAAADEPLNRGVHAFSARCSFEVALGSSMTRIGGGAGGIRDLPNGPYPPVRNIV